jgi:hypothetical protein
MKKILVLAFLLATSLSLVAPVTKADDHKSQYQVGTFLGNEIRADGTYTNNIYCGSGPGYTCTGSAGFNGFRVYYVKTEEGVWSFVTETEAGDVTVRKLGQTPMHFKSEKPNLLDSLKPGDKVAFRTEKDHRIGAGKSMHVFIPQADNPKKEEKFVGILSPKGQPTAPTKPTDNIKALCESGKLSGAACETPAEPAPTAEPSNPADQPSSDGTSDLMCGAFLRGYATTHGANEPPADLKAKYCGNSAK